jgi:hypothetical protein
MENATENMEKKYELRPLEGGDIFIMTSIISKVGVKNIAKCFDSEEIKEARKAKASGDANVDVEAIGSIIICNVLDLVLEKLEYCEDGICKLLARLSGKTPTQIKKLGAVEYLDMFMEVISDKQFADFFMRAYGLLRRMM